MHMHVYKYVCICVYVHKHMDRCASRSLLRQWSGMSVFRVINKECHPRAMAQPKKMMQRWLISVE
jgi:hypothetical protein